MYIYIYTHVSYSINSLFYSWLLILERAVSDIEQLGSSMSHRYHPRPISLPGCNSNEYRGEGEGGRKEALSRVEGGSGLCLPPSSARFQSRRTRMEESAGWALISPVAADVFSIFYLVARRMVEAKDWEGREGRGKGWHCRPRLPPGNKLEPSSVSRHAIYCHLFDTNNPCLPCRVARCHPLSIAFESPRGIRRSFRLMAPPSLPPSHWLRLAAERSRFFFFLFFSLSLSFSLFLPR